MIKRSQYMSHEVTHREYYAQFVTDHMRRTVMSAFGVEKLIDAYREDEHLNGLALAKWDRLAPCARDAQKKLREAGDYMTLCGAVCILKEAGRQVAEANRQVADIGKGK